ncbi:hypothetical protein MUK42_33314 [Musa troglodytarum]|uniref:Uncharacterized protein n=1 Tax=Musa troglodytarum TaxID=320322 RepID=A0A9E7F5I0_9LILI|nr:hypothetical protein MUK42_33314 [Musa troglodytarum]
MNNTGAEPKQFGKSEDVEAKCNIEFLDILFVLSVSDVSLLACKSVVLKGELPFNSLMRGLVHQYIGKVGGYWVKTMASGLNPRREKAARQSKLPSAYLRQLKQCMKNHLVNMK